MDDINDGIGVLLNVMDPQLLFVEHDFFKMVSHQLLTEQVLIMLVISLVAHRHEMASSYQKDHKGQYLSGKELLL